MSKNRREKPSKQRRREQRKNLPRNDMPINDIVDLLIPPDARPITDDVAEEMRAAGINEIDIRDAANEGLLWSRSRRSVSSLPDGL